MSGFSVYVHWPICARKCPYCDFNSHVRENYDGMRWAKAIARELEFVEFAFPSRGSSEIASIFFGGGTPSLAEGKAVGTVLNAIAKHWTIAPDAEITLEANPNSAEQSRFKDYRAAGVNRVSIGAQALDDASLKMLGRLHGADEARAAIRLALSIFPRVSFDLIYARPGQSQADWETELEEAMSFGTEHLSLYQLTVEPGTQFATLYRQGKLSVPGENAAAHLFEATQEACERAGLPAYEVSNHAREGAESRHNLNYWRYGDYIGVGPGAHGRLTSQGRRMATAAERLPERWLSEVEAKGHGLTMTELSKDEAAREHLLMGLRLAEGIDLAHYRRRWGLEPDEHRVAALQEEGLIARSGARIAATPKGRLLLNALIAELAP
jgi:putative oxygen-independent coproporphyrinogen III oxidase